MRAGRKPKPSHLRLLEGNPGKRALNKNEPQPRPSLPKPPPHISAEAKREWRRIGRELDVLGLVTQIDRAALATYCQAWARWVDAEEKLREFGTVIKAPSGYLVQSPYLPIANRAIEHMMKALVEFGMTPSSRSRITLPQSVDDEDGLD